MQWKHHEPLFWGLFGAGGVISAFVLPSAILLVGLAYPLGLLPEHAMSYQQMLALGQSSLGKTGIFSVMALTAWHCAHRIFHSLHDLGYHGGFFARSLTYGSAGIFSVVLGVLLLIL